MSEHPNVKTVNDMTKAIFDQDHDALAKIFTGGIPNWSDPAITHDYGTPLPSQPITGICIRRQRESSG